MLSGGRILHHLARRLDDPENLLCLVGYQAAGTRGRRLLEGERHMRIHGRDVPVRARFMTLGGLSGHADRDELLRWVRSGAGRPKAIFVTHGEDEAAEVLARDLERETGARVHVPDLGEGYDLQRVLRGE